MASSVIGVLVCVCVVMACVHAKEITRDANDIDEAGKALAVDGQLTGPESTAPHTKKKESVEERAIARQLKATKKLKCKPHRAKVYTREELPSDSKYHDWVIYPHVLSVKRCDPNCTYCSQNEQGKEMPGYEDAYFKCMPTEQRVKKYTIKTYNKNNGNRKEYFKLPIKIDVKCACTRRDAKT